jgi:hypothetical protein
MASEIAITVMLWLAIASLVVLCWILAMLVVELLISVCGIDGVTDLVEIKFEKGTLTSDQQIFHRDWKGSPVVIVRTHADVVIHVGQMRIRAK